MGTKGRYSVRLAGGSLLALKPSNLEALSEAEEDVPSAAGILGAAGTAVDSTRQHPAPQPEDYGGVEEEEAGTDSVSEEEYDNDADEDKELDEEEERASLLDEQRAAMEAILSQAQLTNAAVRGHARFAAPPAEYLY